MNEEEFLKKLHEAFALEAEEHFDAIRSGLAELEQGASDSPSALVEYIFRKAHSLKGAARAINRGDIEALCQQFESLFARWKKDVDTLNHAPFGLCAEAVDLLEQLLQRDTEASIAADPLLSLVERLREAASNHTGGEALMPTVSDGMQPLQHDSMPAAHADALPSRPRQSASPSPLVSTSVPLQHAPHDDAAGKSPTAASAAKALKDTVRVSIQELDALYRQVEELSTVKYLLGRMTNDMRLVIDQCREWKNEYQKYRMHRSEIAVKNGGPLHNSALPREGAQHFMKWTARQIEGMEVTITKGIEDARGTMYIMDAMSDALIDHSRRLLLLPFSVITDALPSMVNNIARDVGKKVDLTIRGVDVRIDKRILEELKDPLIHLLRNAIDHGIEDAAVRSERNKHPMGQLRLDISMTGDNRVEVSLSDDGAGIDVHAVRQRALADGMSSESWVEALSDTAALELIFSSGISTAGSVTELSGRGIGLAVVKENVAALGGEVTVSTQPGSGSTFRLLLPVSLSNARGVMVSASGRMYVIPLQYIVRGLSLLRTDIGSIDGKQVFDYQGASAPLFRLEDMLGMPAANTVDKEKEAVLVLNYADTVFGLRVGEVLWEQDVVIKPLPSPITRVRGIAGATLLGTGELAPVLHVPDLLDILRGSGRNLLSETAPEETRKIFQLLVVDDSITSRVLLHDILVSSGYQVKTAVDGIDALTHLRESSYDLVVSDVEMPRMNGFELTQAIRNDEKLSGIPVVLVTGLESQEDRERGFDVGANAYIIKSGFDQSNLLEIITRLI
jgi:two-component system, chemotaxis family, sensor kinase CheA